jgi:protein-S-isoprenylcysteine O-methyltransferase Ste14
MVETLFNQIKEKLILNNYYNKTINKGKTARASILDWIFIIFVLGGFFIITTFNSTKNIVISIVLTSILILISIFIFFVLARRKRTKEVAKINENLSDEEILNGIEKLNNPEYLLYIKELLEKYYNTNLSEIDEYIDFMGEINGEKYGIKCFKSSIENIITEKDIRNYHLAMINEGLEYGIIISNSYFHEDLKEKFDYILIDFKFMKEILKELGKYPTQEEVQELILSNYKNKRTGLVEDFKRNNKKKIYRFSLLGFILYLISPYTSFTQYYRISGVVLIFIGLVLGLNKLVVFLKTNTDFYSK